MIYILENIFDISGNSNPQPVMFDVSVCRFTFEDYMAHVLFHIKNSVPQTSKEMSII